MKPVSHTSRAQAAPDTPVNAPKSAKHQKANQARRFFRRSKTLDKDTLEQRKYQAQSVVQVVRDAKARMQASADKYVAAHMLSIDLALKAKSDKALDVARKGAEFGLQNLSVVDPSTGERVHLIDPKEESRSNLPSITIGIALGGSPSSTHYVDQRNGFAAQDTLPSTPPRSLPPAETDDDE